LQQAASLAREVLASGQGLTTLLKLVELSNQDISSHQDNKKISK
jgi:anthranilate phosphoribosyltransferase